MLEVRKNEEMTPPLPTRHNAKVNNNKKQNNNNNNNNTVSSYFEDYYYCCCFVVKFSTTIQPYSEKSQKVTFHKTNGFHGN